jgi:uncharacterized protein YegL
MKKGLTELVFIIDRSGSMEGLESDTIGGFNAMLKVQKALEGEAVVTTVLFDDKYELLHDRIDIKAIKPLTDKDYSVRGSTALLDALGKTVNKIRAVQKATAEEYRAEKVLFVIITDGMENASREYTAEKIKARVERQREKYGWEFIFLGANMDAIAEAGKIGIAADRAQNYSADSIGTSTAWESVTKTSTSYRSGTKNAFANLKMAVRGLKNTADDLVDFVEDAGAAGINVQLEENGIVARLVDLDGSIRPTANDIMRKILEDELKELESNGGDESRINEPRNILRQ